MSAREKEEKVSLESYEEVLRGAHLREPWASSRDLSLPLQNGCACTELPVSTCRHRVLIPSVLTTVSDSQEKFFLVSLLRRFLFGDSYEVINI